MPKSWITDKRLNKHTYKKKWDMSKCVFLVLHWDTLHWFISCSYDWTSNLFCVGKYPRIINCQRLYENGIARVVTLTVKKYLLMFRQLLLCFGLPIPSGLLTVQHWKEPGLSSLHPPFQFLYTLMRSPPWAFSRLNTIGSLSLSYRRDSPVP